MVSLSVAWVIVTIVKQKEVNSFEFNPVIFLLTGVLDVIMVGLVAIAFSGAG